MENGTPDKFIVKKENDDEETENELELSEEAKEDYQLLRAIDLLRGVALYNSNQPMKVTEEDKKDEKNDDSSSNE